MNCERCHAITKTRFRIRGVVPWLCLSCIAGAGGEPALLQIDLDAGEAPFGPLERDESSQDELAWCLGGGAAARASSGGPSRDC